MAEDYEAEFQAEEAVEVHEAEAVKNLESSEATSEEVLEVVQVLETMPTPTSVSVGKAPKKWSSKSVGGSAPSNIGEVGVVLNVLNYQASSRNSASVRVLQDRLAELGHGSVRRDRQGWLSDGTVEALREFQTEAGLEVTGEADHDTVVAVLKGTKAKVI